MTKPLKVLHVIESLGSGGAERLLNTNLKHFRPAAVESTVVTVHSRGDYWLEKIETLGVRVFSLECQGLRGFPAAIRRLEVIIGETGADLVHTHLWAANVVGRVAAHRVGTCVISSIHNPEYETPARPPGRLGGLKVWVAKTLDRHTANYCDQMVAVSSYVKESAALHLRYPAEKIKVLHNPVDVKDIDRAAARAKIRAELGVGLNTPILLNIGRLSEQKGFIHAIRAMPEVLENYPDALLLSIGNTSGNMFNSIESKIQELGVGPSIKILGERRNVEEYLAACDLFVFPSEFEGLGIAIAEAMAIGCACIASDIEPLNEFINDGVNGILVEPKRPAALAAAALRLLEDSVLRGRLGAAGRESVCERFRPQPAADRLTEIYLAASRERRGNR